MALATFTSIAGVLADINACREFFSWVTPGVLAQHQIQERGQLKTKLDELNSDLWKLKTTMPKMLDLIDRVEWQSHKKPAAELLPDIKDAVYDAEDLLDEFSYYALKVKVEESKNSGKDHMHNAFLEFFKSVEHCDHFNKVKEIQGNLDHIHDQSKDLGLHQAPQKFDKSVRPETTSFSDEPQIFGREKELKQLLEKLGVRARKRGRTDDKARMTELHVLPIVGMGGLGKTTMAQQICNDATVNQHFDNILWTCVSDDFDIKRLTKEILEQLGQVTVSDNLDVLMKDLASYVESKKFLLVLDDMWEDILKDNGAGWKRFCAPLRNGLQGSKILVTTRSSMVANLVGNMNDYHYELKGLQDDVFWDFFKLCAFESNSSCNNRKSLERIGKDILPKLKGSPLAAITIGRLLRLNLNTAHWEYIMKSELWQLEQTETDILPALRLSYMYLPQQLKRCFSICALYPKDHLFEKKVLVDIWVAQGYVEGPKDASECLDALLNRSFFQVAAQKNDKYVVHDLMHDMAQLVSKDECFIIKQAGDLCKVPPNVRHLSVFTNQNVGCSALKSICSKGKLRSLVCNEFYTTSTDFSAVIDSWFTELLKIRVLSFKLSRVRKLPESMGNSKHLRRLCLDGGCTFDALPSSVCRLHHLRSIDAQDCAFKSFPEGFSDVISLQKIESRNFSYNKDDSDRLWLSWKTGLIIEMVKNQMEPLPHWNLRHLVIENCKFVPCPTWFQPNHLEGLLSLKLHNCGNFGYSTDHFVSCFRDLASLEITFGWLIYMNLKLWSSTLPCLEDLCISNCSSLKSIGLSEASSSSSVGRAFKFLSDMCSSLTSIGLSEARSSSSSVGAFKFLAKLRITSCESLQSLDEFLTPAYLPAAKAIHVGDCSGLTSLPVDRLHGFSELQELHIYNCPKLNMQGVMTLPSSLKELNICKCGSIESIDNRRLESSSPALDRLLISDCPDLRSIVGAIAVSQIEHVFINNCPKLQEIEQPFRKPKQKQRSKRRRWYVLWHQRI